MNKKTAIEDYAREAGEKGFCNGAYLLAQRGEIVSSGAYGTRDVEQTLPLNVDSSFDLASVSKQFTAAAVMLLNRKGLLSLDDGVERFFPDLPYKGRTARHLLTHTAGLPDYESWICDDAEKQGVIPANSIIERFVCECGKPEVFAPGDRWDYSNTGYSLLAALVERVADMPFADSLRRELFAPAGMANTGVYHRRKDGASIADYAYGLVFENGEYVLPDGCATCNEVVPLDGIEGDGAVSSTVYDMFLWDKALREESVLSRAEQEQMYAPVTLNDGSQQPYGFGRELARDDELGRIVKHSGYWPGYSTEYVRFTDADIVLVLLMNRTGFDNLAWGTFIDGMTRIAMGKEPRTLHALDELIIPDAYKSAWPSFCGKYEGGYAVYERGGRLFLSAHIREERAMEIELLPTGESRFGAREAGFEFIFSNGVNVNGKEYRKLSNGD